MIRKSYRRLFGAGLVAAALAAAAGVPATLAQDDRGRQAGERRVDPIDLPLDKPGVWTLHFRYKPPRITTVDGFDAKGKPAKQTVWYMWYQVFNRSGEPVYFIPEFELVTKDLNTTHLDEPQPYIFEQVKKFEDRTIIKEKPNGELNLLSTIEISRRPIPATKPDGFPKLVSGLAVWTDMADKAPKTNRFSVYVTGLSNGVASEQTKPIPPKNEVVTLIKKKTLRIDFIRPTDDNRQAITDIRPDDENGPSETWVYRTRTSTILKSKVAGPAAPEEEKKKAD
ncbi:MAG: hypothetical protein JWO38_1851 [Gemmataceae bacterium]|nr:hypothetical protein [Gemmataceae bacterium]